jgi:hypothetical protein
MLVQRTTEGSIICTAASCSGGSLGYQMKTPPRAQRGFQLDPFGKHAGELPN